MRLCTRALDDRFRAFGRGWCSYRRLTAYFFRSHLSPAVHVFIFRAHTDHSHCFLPPSLCSYPLSTIFDIVLVVVWDLYNPLFSGSRRTLRGSRSRLIGRASPAADVVAERVRAPAHPVPAPAVPVGPLAAPAARPAALELLQPAGAGAAVGRGEAAPGGARVVVVHALGLVEIQVRAGGLDGTILRPKGDG